METKKKVVTDVDEDVDMTYKGIRIQGQGPGSGTLG